MDLVLIDAPCSGTGVWRRRPDAKWRLNPVQLLERLSQQRELLSTAASLVKPGGTLAYVTCSLLPQENDQQIEAFLEGSPGFTALDMAARAKEVLSQPNEPAPSGQARPAPNPGAAWDGRILHRALGPPALANCTSGGQSIPVAVKLWVACKYFLLFI